jgi:hypothetical protein
MSDKDWEELKHNLHDPEYVEKFITAAVYLINEEDNDNKS